MPLNPVEILKRRQALEKALEPLNSIKQDGVDVTAIKTALQSAFDSTLSFADGEYTGLETSRKSLSDALATLGYKDGDVSAFVTTLSEKLKTPPSQNPNPNDSQIEKLKQTVELLTTSLNKEKEARELSDKKVSDEGIKKKLNESLKDVLGANTIVENLMLTNRVKMVDGQIVFDDGAGKLSLFDDGVKALRETHKDLIRDSQGGGGGSQGESGGGTDDATMKQEIEAMFDQ